MLCPTSSTLRQHCINVIETYRASVQCHSNLANMRRCREQIFNKNSCSASIADDNPALNQHWFNVSCLMGCQTGGGPRVVVSTAAFHARVRSLVPSLGGLKETKMFLPHPRVKVSIVGSLRDREVACSASYRQGSNFESCVWRAVSSKSSHHPQEVLLAQFSLSGTKVA